VLPGPDRKSCSTPSGTLITGHPAETAETLTVSDVDEFHLAGHYCYEHDLSETQLDSSVDDYPNHVEVAPWMQNFCWLTPDREHFRGVDPQDHGVFQPRWPTLVSGPVQLLCDDYRTCGFVVAAPLE